MRAKRWFGNTNSRLCQWLLALLLASAGMWPLAAWSHAHPEERHPAAGATLQQSPTEVRIRFSEELEEAFSSLKVTDQQGRAVHQGETRVPDTDAHVLTTQLQPLQAGTYTVHWRVVARDGHATKGEYTFEVTS